MGKAIQLPLRHDLRLVITYPERPAATGRAPFAVDRKIGVDCTRIVVKVSGDVDLCTAPVLAEALTLAVLDTKSRSGISEIVVDLRRVAFLGAAGLSVLVDASDRCVRDEIGFHVAADHTPVTRPITTLRLDHALGLCPHPDKAGT
jgi:anti-sigma B factor antagonist